jgi:serine/threonine protein kinase
MTNNPSPDGDHTLPHTDPSDQHQETLAFPPAPPAGESTLVVQAPGLPVVPGYVVTREVARGGMGIVYAAHDPTFDRELAIKVMYPGQDAARFVVEARVTAGLPHPGVPPVHTLGALADGRPFLTMKLIRGRTLADELRAVERADLPHLLDVFERICLTVGFAHSRGVIHRDLKPQNVMVGSFGEVQVMDWGLARPTKDEEQTDTPEGSPSSFLLPPFLKRWRAR